MFNNKTILITGGTGSFGKGFTKYLLNNYQFKKLIIFSRDELKQSEMKQELNDNRLRFFLGDVRDLQRLQRAFQGVDIVIHAAALKQVPTLEYNPFEAVKTNILGTKNVIDAAIDQKVSKALLVSTDKAAKPVNLYGATKLTAERLFIDGNSYSAGTTKFACVRYGNVLGSRGSIVDKILSMGDNDTIEVTDERMTRFWITLEQAYDLVIFALKNCQGGEIYIPKIPSMKLVDLLEVIKPGAKTKISGIRPGEKIHEVLISEEEARHAIELDNYYVILPEFESADEIKEKFGEFIKSSKSLTEDFKFSSDSNKQWLTKEDLNKMIEKIKNDSLR